MFYGTLAEEENHKYLLGTIDFGEEDSDKNEENLQEDQLYPGVNLGSGLDKCNIWIYTNEGTIPHFHIVNNSKNFESCICLITNKYFIHGSKTDTLKSSQSKILNKYMKTINSKEVPLTNWQVACDIWNKNTNYKIDKKIYSNSENQPDYSKISLN